MLQPALKINVGLFSEQCTGLRAVASTASDSVAPSWPALRDQWQQALAQKIAIEPFVDITLIVNPGQLAFGGVNFKLQARCRQPGPVQWHLANQHTGIRHTGQTTLTGAAQQAQKNGFRLIVLVMRQQQHIAGLHMLAKRLITRIARPFFDIARLADCLATDIDSHRITHCSTHRTSYRYAQAGMQPNSHRFQWHLALLAILLTMAKPVVGVTTQTVMYVYRSQTIYKPG